MDLNGGGTEWIDYRSGLIVQLSASASTFILPSVPGITSPIQLTATNIPNSAGIGILIYAVLAVIIIAIVIGIFVFLKRKKKSQSLASVKVKFQIPKFRHPRHQNYRLNQLALSESIKKQNLES